MQENNFDNKNEIENHNYNVVMKKTINEKQEIEVNNYTKENLTNKNLNGKYIKNKN